jgi:hypothetical protein
MLARFPCQCQFAVLCTCWPVKSGGSETRREYCIALNDICIPCGYICGLLILSICEIESFHHTGQERTKKAAAEGDHCGASATNTWVAISTRESFHHVKAKLKMPAESHAAYT